MSSYLSIKHPTIKNHNKIKSFSILIDVENHCLNATIIAVAVYEVH